MKSILRFLYFLVVNKRGKSGVLLRRWLGRGLFREVGRGLTIHEGVDILGFENISFGDNVTVMRFSSLHAHEGGELHIGDSFSMNSNSQLGAAGSSIHIGPSCLVGSNCVLRAADHGFRQGGVPIRQQGHVAGPIRLEGDNWLGSNVVITKDVVMGAGAVAAAGAVVTQSVLPRQIVGGVPAKPIGARS